MSRTWSMGGGLLFVALALFVPSAAVAAEDCDLEWEFDTVKVAEPAVLMGWDWPRGIIVSIHGPDGSVERREEVGGPRFEIAIVLDIPGTYRAVVEADEGPCSREASLEVVGWGGEMPDTGTGPAAGPQAAEPMLAVPVILAALGSAVALSRRRRYVGSTDPLLPRA